MASFVCENCNFKYIAKPEGFCVNCGYSFDYIRNYKNFAPSQLRNMPSLIKVRQTPRLLHHHQSGHPCGDL